MKKPKGKFIIDKKKKSTNKKAIDSLKSHGFNKDEDVHGGFIKMGAYEDPEASSGRG